jgi:hypothetical protein
MIIVNVFVESGCSFNDEEYRLDLEAVVQDSLSLHEDIDHIKDCIENYEGEIKEEIVYTFFLHRANIQTAYPGYESAFDIQQVIENIGDINIQL